MIIYPVSGSKKPGKVVIAFSSDGGTEAAGDYTWTQHSESMRRVRTLVYESHSAGLFLTAGDNACQGAAVNGGYSGQCGQFLGPVGRIKAAMGNHDNTDMGGISGFTSFFGYSAPSHSWKYGNIEGFSCYSFDDAGTEFNPGTPQYQWLSRSLAASRADPTVKWRIANFHTPVQCSSTVHAPNASAQSFPWSSWGIDAVFHGHNHTVERLETGSLAVYVCGGIGNQKTGYQYTAISTHSRWIYTNDTNPYPLARDYVFMIIESEGDTLSLSFYNSSGSKLQDTGSTFIPNAQIIDNSLVLTKTEGSQPTASGITYTVISNKFVETGSWEMTGSTLSPTRSVYLSQTASYNVWANGWALEPKASSTGSDWVSASFDDTAPGWTSSLPGALRNNDPTPPSPPGWQFNTTTLTDSNLTGVSSHYFRTKFNIPHDPSVYAFTASYICDDGIAVWINNKLALTRLMPATWSWNQLTDQPGDATASWSDTLTSSYFVQGENIVAIELHQRSVDSTDVTMGFELTGSYRGFEDTGSQPPPLENAVNLYLINRTSSWIIYDKQGEPSDANRPYQFVSWSYYNNGSASNAKWGWESGSHSGGVGSGSYHNPAEPNSPVGWTYHGTCSYTSSVGPWTFLFLKTFDVPYTPKSNHTFTFRTFYDDGIFIYLNGDYVASSGMGTRTKDYHQFAAANIEPDTEYVINLDYSLFNSGSNLMVVELHQSVSSSSDLAFGGELIYTGSESTGSDNTGSSGSLATTGSKFRFSQGGVMSCLAGPYSESLPNNSYANAVLVARMSSNGIFYANEFSEIPVSNTISHRYDAGDAWSTSSAVQWLNTIINQNHLNKINTTYVSESSSYRFTNLASYNDVGISDYFTSDEDLSVLSVISGSPFWTYECVFKLHNSCSLQRGYLVGRYSGSAVSPNRRATGFFTTQDNVLHINYFNYTTDGGTTWFETTSSIITLSLNQWYHAAMSYTTQSDGSSSFKTYLNGLLQFSASYLTSSYDIQDGSNIYVGGAPALDSGKLDQSSNAYIGVVAFYSRSLYNQEVRSCALYYNKEYDFNI